MYQRSRGAMRVPPELSHAAKSAVSAPLAARPAAPPSRAPKRAFEPTAGPPLATLDFEDDYRLVRLTARQLRDRDECRFEIWDGATETAVELRDAPGPHHERPAQILVQAVERIAQVRGAPIACYGGMGLVLPAKAGQAKRIMQADQVLYLHPERANLDRPGMVVGANPYPDVVLEVDLTTDIRRHKLKLYEAWGFPELWVAVPERSHRPRKPRATTIYLHDGEGYVSVAESRAFPSWTAAEIHVALNEKWVSERTSAVLERIGRILGGREGTGPEDDPLLRSQRSAAREEVRGRGSELVRALLASRGLNLGPLDLLDEPDFAALPARAIVDAALNCKDEADFVAWLRRAVPNTALGPGL